MNNGTDTLGQENIKALVNYWDGEKRTRQNAINNSRTSRLVESSGAKEPDKLEAEVSNSTGTDYLEAYSSEGDLILKMGLLDASIREVIPSYLGKGRAPLEDAWFITVTFKTPRNPNESDATLSAVSDVLWRSGVDYGFLGTELHSNGNLHVHGVVAPSHGLLEDEVDFEGYTADSRRTILWRDLFRTFGRAEVYRVRSVGAVIDYCSNYVTKKLTDYTLI